MAAAGTSKGGKGKGLEKGKAAAAAAESGPVQGRGKVSSNASAAQGEAKGRGKADGRPQGALADRCQIVAVPAPNRGRILGEGGRNFKHIEERTGVRLVLEAQRGEPAPAAAAAASEEALQVRVLGGPRAHMDRAVSLLRDLLAASADQGEARAGGKTGSRSSAARAAQCQIVPVPTPNRGAILGEGGSNFKHIQEQTGVRLVLELQGGERESPAAPRAMQVRVLRGPRADMEAALSLVRDLLDSVASLPAKTSGEGRGRGRGGRRAEGEGRGPRGELQELIKDRQSEAEGKQSEAEDLRQQAAVLQQEVRQLKASVPAILPMPRTQPVVLFDGAVLDAARAATSAAEGRAVVEADSPAWEQALEFWRVLDARREEVRAPKDLGREELLERREERRRRLEERKRLQAEQLEKAQLAEQLSSRARSLQSEAQALSSKARSMQSQEALLARGRAAGSTGSGRVGGFCALFPLGACPFEGGRCPRGTHGEPPIPSEDEVLVRTSGAKQRLLQQKWRDAGGQGELLGAWQVQNPRLELLLRATESDFAVALGAGSDVIDGWHGTEEQNVLSIACSGFDPRRRCGQAFGAGEYFAKNPVVSIGYARGGAFMFLCKLVLGKADLDHSWVSNMQYYVLKQRDCRIQAVPLFLVQFKASQGDLAGRLKTLKTREEEEPMLLVARQAGALRPCEGRRDAGMAAPFTRHLWVGWLFPGLRSQDDEAVAEDVAAFLRGHEVAQVIPERNGARIGAFVLLQRPVSKEEFQELQGRLYRGQHRVSVDDQQPNNPRCEGRVCPRLAGPSRYCRGWNLRGHRTWQWGCSFAHPPERRPTHGATYHLEPLPKGSAKYDDIATELLRSAPFVSADGRCGNPRIVAVHRVDNPLLANAYEERRGFLHDKQGFAMERELWHGTNCKAIPELLTHGLQPPSDTCPCSACPVSGGKGLCTTLCGADCRHCREAHCWGKCHMYGLGVYMADLAQKSHRYVREPARPAATAQGRASTRQVYSMLRCRVALGNPFLIEGNLLKQDAMHDFVWCQDPSEALERCSDKFNLTKGHDAFYVRGLSGAQKAGLGVYNSEYIVFHPYQILPLYQVDYVLE